VPRSVVLRLSPGEKKKILGQPDLLRRRAALQLELPPDQVLEVRLRKVSFDARPRHMKWRVEGDAWLAGEQVPPIHVWEPHQPASPAAEAPRVVVVGCGPAGLFCALDLVQAGLRVTILERGKEVQARRRDIAALQHGAPADPDSNYCFGEGGAGTYSDGKLYTRSGKPEAVREILEILVAHGAPRSILVDGRPHIGSNLLPKVVVQLRERLRSLGVRVRFESRVTDLEVDEEAGARTVRGVGLEVGRHVAAEAVVLATGHSALDALLMARAAGAPLEAKGFAMGVRIEHPQDWLDACQYHGARETAQLPAAYYQLATQAGGHGVYSFCMCPGGWIVPSQTDPATLVVNGMSLSRRDSPFANSGIVVAIEPEDWCGARGGRWGWPDLLRRAAAVSPHPLLHESWTVPAEGTPIDPAAGRLPAHPGQDPLFGVRLQIALETLAARAGGGNNRAPAQRCDQFVAGKGETSDPLPSSFRPGLTAADFASFLPHGLLVRLRAGLQAFDKRIPGMAGSLGQLVGVETRTSSPVRVVRDPQTLQSPGVDGLYPCGEGAGYAGGIVSSALDGRRVARSIRKIPISTSRT